jgi:hypothetical protein
MGGDSMTFGGIERGEGRGGEEKVGKERPVELS